MIHLYFFHNPCVQGKSHPHLSSFVIDLLLCFRVKAQSVKYILLFLYGAMVEVPTADITSVIQASDMFGVEGLKEWLGFLIARDFCHFFHKVSRGPLSPLLQPLSDSAEFECDLAPACLLCLGSLHMMCFVMN